MLVHQRVVDLAIEHGDFPIEHGDIPTLYK